MIIYLKKYVLTKKRLLQSYNIINLKNYKLYKKYFHIYVI